MKIAKLFIWFLACFIVFLTGCSDDDKPAAYLITVTNDGNGTAVADQQRAEAGATVTLTATPGNGYVFLKWTVESGDVAITDMESNPATFTMPAGDVVVKAKFVSGIAHTITVTTDGNGTAKADKEKATDGTEVTLTAVPKDGYLFAQWVIESGDITITDVDTNPATFTMPAEPVTVKAEFVSKNEETYAITVNNDGQGTATANRLFAAKGMSVTLKATPNEGFEFARWFVDDGSATINDPTSNPATFTMPANPVTIHATFVQGRAYKVTVTNDGNGGKAVADLTEARRGNKVTLTATPNKGYEFKKWDITQGDVSINNNSANPATFIMPAEDVTIKAEFAAIYTINITNNGYGTAVANKEKAEYKETVTLTATPDSGCTFSHWIVENTNTFIFDNPSANPLEFAMPTTNLKIKAVFKDPDDVFTMIFDAKFLSYCKQFDTNGDGKLSFEEAAAVKTIDLSGPAYYYYSNIASLVGIEYFTSLETLICKQAKLTSLDLSKNTALTYLDCSGNSLTELNLCKNTALTYLDCRSNKLTDLDLSKNTALTYLDCYYNSLTGLDLSNNTALTYLDCRSNKLTNLDLNNNMGLTYLNCGSNALTILDLSNNKALTEVYCSSNKLTTLILSNSTTLMTLDCSSNSFTNLDFSNKANLVEIKCEYAKKLSSINLSNCTSLKRIDCNSGGGLTNLNVHGCIALEYIDCGSNQLITLDVRDNIALIDLNCSNNKLTNIDVTKNIALKRLEAGENLLTTLDVSKNTALEELWCDRNKLTELDVTNTFINVPSTSRFNLYCGYQSAGASSYQNLFLTIREDQKPYFSFDIRWNSYVILVD